MKNVKYLVIVVFSLLTTDTNCQNDTLKLYDKDRNISYAFYKRKFYNCDVKIASYLFYPPFKKMSSQDSIFKFNRKSIHIEYYDSRSRKRISGYLSKHDCCFNGNIFIYYKNGNMRRLLRVDEGFVFSVKDKNDSIKRLSLTDGRIAYEIEDYYKNEKIKRKIWYELEMIENNPSGFQLIKHIVKYNKKGKEKKIIKKYNNDAIFEKVMRY
jgi:hypothetical protein